MAASDADASVLSAFLFQEPEAGNLLADKRRRSAVSGT